MAKPSRQLADRYQLRLSDTWVRWFDADRIALVPAGAMRQSLSSEILCAGAPIPIWPGFMLPDTLPLIGNEYGDWLCVRVTAENEFGELLYWYHGGGDWIPVGFRMAEALLHDAVDQFRSLRWQMIRGATETRTSESRAEVNAQVLSRLKNPRFHRWIVSQLAYGKASVTEVENKLATLESTLQRDDHGAAIGRLFEFRWAADAAACDLIEESLQGPLQLVARHAIAEEIEIPWFPDFARFLFDPSVAEDDLRTRVAQVVGITDADWPQQRWDVADTIAHQVLARRSDLGWPFAIAGWNQEKLGHYAAAKTLYRQGRFASSFADQAVRFNCHCLAEKTGKFSIDRLLQLPTDVQNEKDTDPYLSLFSSPIQRSILNEVHDYWWSLGGDARKAEDFETAYDCFFRSGWDLGVSRLSEYQKILEALTECADAAGWHARARVAETHLNCLHHRMK